MQQLLNLKFVFYKGIYSVRLCVPVLPVPAHHLKLVAGFRLRILGRKKNHEGNKQIRPPSSFVFECQQLSAYRLCRCYVPRCTVGDRSSASVATEDASPDSLNISIEAPRLATRRSVVVQWWLPISEISTADDRDPQRCAARASPRSGLRRPLPPPLQTGPHRHCFGAVFAARPLLHQYLVPVCPYQRYYSHLRRGQNPSLSISDAGGAGDEQGLLLLWPTHECCSCEVEARASQSASVQSALLRAPLRVLVVGSSAAPWHCSRAAKTTLRAGPRDGIPWTAGCAAMRHRLSF